MRHRELGKLIKRERERLGWEQTELAARLSIKQQTVSRWEKGTSRPEQDVLLMLIDLFSVDSAEWQTKAGYIIEEPDTSLTPYLPLHNLSAENFELFCRDLIKVMNPTADVSRYGTHGFKQDGIDIVAKIGNSVLDFQCKRHNQFGPAEIEKAVKKVDFKADHHYILLSRIASPQARKEILKHDNWTLWDREDIAHAVRFLRNKDEAVRLVDTYFQGWSKRFLDVEGPSLWITSEEFFRSLKDRIKLFSHGWSFVGRSEELAQLKEFESNKAVQAIVLAGRGGIGKSRLLKSWVDNLDRSVNVRFVYPGSEVEPKDLDLLPKGPSFLVIDDAHERSDISMILNGVVRMRPEMKVILSSRPYGVSHLHDELFKSGMPYDLEGEILLDNLSIKEAQSLSEEILKDPNVKGDPVYAQRIATITKDCPLATVIGSRLVGEGLIKPDLLSNEKRFREELLSRFRDVIAGEIGGSDPKTIRDLLDVLAMIQPFDPSDVKLQEMLGKLIGDPVDKTIRNISALEEAGVLLRRGSRLRIVPDLLADFIRASAAYDEKNKKPTGYVDRIFSLLNNELAKNLLVNVSQLDWRLSADGVQSAILDEIWKKIFTEIKEANNAERCVIIKELKDVAYYQPTELLKFVEYLKDNPATKEEDKEYSGIYKYEHGNVLAELPEILRRIGYNMELLPQCADLIWEIAKNDKRRTNSHSDHGIRILQDLAKYDIYELTGKSVEVNTIMLEAVKRWLKDPSIQKYANSPLDILDEFIVKDSTTDVYDKGKITFHSFGVHFENTKKLRDEAIKLIVDLAHSPYLSISLRAIKSLQEALSEPRELMGRKITPDEEQKWKPFQLQVLGFMEELSKKQTHPIAQLEIKECLAWHVRYSKSSEIKEKARKLFEVLSQPYENKLMQALESPNDRDWFLEEEKYDYEKISEMNLTFRKNVAHVFVEKFPSHIEGFNMINSLLKDAEDSGMNPFPIAFLAELAKLHTPYAKGLAQIMLRNPKSHATANLGFILFGLIEKDSKLTREIASKAIEIGEERLSGSIADYYWRAKWTNYFDEEDIENIKKLIDCKFWFAKKMAIGSVGRLGKLNPELTKQLLMAVNLDENRELADEYFGQFDKEYYFDPDLLSEVELEEILKKLEVVLDIDDHNIEQFLNYAADRVPLLVINLLLKRIEISKGKSRSRGDNYQPLSYSSRSFINGFSKTKKYSDVLRQVRDRVLENDWQAHFWIPKLFKAISNNFDDSGKEVLMEWIRTGEKEKIEGVGTILKDAPENFVFHNTAFVSEMLSKAKPYGHEFLKSARTDLAHSTIYRSKSGTPGQPMTEDVELRENSQKMMENYPPGSLEYELYESLLKHANWEIEDHIKRDEDLWD